MPKLNFKGVINNYQSFKKRIPVILGEQAKNFFQDSWEKQGWDDGGVKKWKEVQRRIPGTRAYKYPKKKDRGRRTRAILVGKGSGKLRRDIRRVYTSFGRTVIATSLPYAKRHNEGLNDMPIRRYMGASKTLDKIQLKTIGRELVRIFK